MKRILILLGVACVSLGCTEQELAEWVAWHERDPQAAIASLSTPQNHQVWDDLAWCESGQRWAYNGRSGYDGGLQFHPATWRAYGGGEFAAYAYLASREQQIIVAERVLDDVGWKAWPTCSRKLGLR